MAKNNKAPAPARGAEASTQNARRNPTAYAPTSAIQRRMVLAALHQAKTKGCTTIDLRHFHGVMHPAARVMELRDAGAEIVTRWDRDTTPDGIAHRVARYVLVSAGGTA